MYFSGLFAHLLTQKFSLSTTASRKTRRRMGHRSNQATRLNRCEHMETRVLLAATPTAINLSNNSVLENQVQGTEVGAFSTVDADQAEGFAYSLVSGTGANDNALFKIVDNKLNTNGVFDFEGKKSYTVRVRSTDLDNNIVESFFNITISDVNESFPNKKPVNISLSNLVIAENNTPGMTVGLLSTSDPDSGNPFAYSLVSGTGSNDNGLFSIVNDQLRLNGSADFEAKKTFSVRVRSTDQGGQLFEKIFVIRVTNVNDAPCNLTLTSAKVSENLAVNTLVGNLKGTDPDAGAILTYSFATGVGSDNNSSFKLVGNQLRTNAVFNFEDKSSYTVRLKVTDQFDQSFEKAFTINIVDQKEKPSNLTLSNSSVFDHHAIGTLVGNLSALDPDIGSTLKFSLIKGAGDTGNAKFAIVGNQLVTKVVFTVPPMTQYSIRVRVMDQTGLFVDQVFSITIQSSVPA
jgi:hypothetical protein